MDWDPGASSEAVRKVNGFLDRAVQQIALDAPFLFHEEELRFRTQVTVEPTLAQDGLLVMTDNLPPQTAVNPWTLTTFLDRSTTDVVEWSVDRTWDGRRLDLLDASGNVLHRTRIQSVSNYNDGTSDLVKVTITTPIDTDTHGSGPFKFRVYTSEYWLQDDIIEIRNIRVLSESSRRPIKIIGQRDAEDIALPGMDSISAPGTPRVAYRRGNMSLPSPNTGPAVELGDETVATERWQGPEPPGKFSYVITYTWGKRSAEYRNSGPGWWAGGALAWDNEGPGSSNTTKPWSEDRFKEPLWESAPSPVSAEVTVPAPATLGTNVGAVKLTLPNIEYQLGFLLAGTTSFATAFERANTGLSGWHVRVYRRRHTADFTNYTGFGGTQLGQSIDSLHKLDIDDAFYLLLETSIDDINEGVVWDYGRIVPDFRRRLRDVHGYQGIQLWPWPDAEYDIEMRVLRRPKRLVSDQDTPHVRAEAADLILFKAATYLYEHLGQPGSAAQSEMNYNDRLQTLRKRYGDLRPSGVPVYKKKARFGGFRRSRTLWNRIGDDS